MKIRYKYLFFIVVLAFYACDSKVVYDGKYDDSDAVFLSMTKEYTLNLDGSQKYAYSQKLRLQSHASFNSMYADSHIDYDPMFQKVMGISSVTHNSMGTSVIKANAINDILPRNAQNSAYYNRLREKVVSHMGTELGAIIDFKYEIESVKNYKPGLFEEIIIPQSSPVRKSKIVVKIPSVYDLNYKLFNSNIRPTVEQFDKQKIYTWVFNDVDEIIVENGSPSYRNEIPRLIFSTVTKKTSEQFIRKYDLHEKDSIFFIPIVNNIKSNLKKYDKLFLKLQDEVVDNIALNNINFRKASYRTRSPKKIWEDASASSMEKCFLLKQLLNIAGYDAEVLIAVPKDLFFQANINYNLWYNSFVHLIDGDNSYLLKGDEKNVYDSSYDINGYKLLNPFTGDEVKFSVDTNSIAVKGNIWMKTRKYIWGREYVSLSGKPSHSLKHGNPKYFKLMMNHVSSYSGKNVKEKIYRIVDTVSGKKLKGKYFKYSLPQYMTGFKVSELPVMTRDRKTSLEIANTINESYSYKLLYGKWYRPLVRDTIIQEENIVGKVFVSFEKVSDSISYIKYKRSISIKQKRIKPSEYKAFKRLIDIWADKKNKEIYFTFN